MRNAIAALCVCVSVRLRDAWDSGTDRGLTTTEVAVLTFVFAAVALALVGLFINFASNTVNDAPPPEILNLGE